MTTTHFHSQPCRDAVLWVGYRDLETAWRECRDADWLTWLAARVGAVDHKQVVRVYRREFPTQGGVAGSAQLALDSWVETGACPIEATFPSRDEWLKFRFHVHCDAVEKVVDAMLLTQTPNRTVAAAILASLILTGVNADVVRELAPYDAVRLSLRATAGDAP